jgi:murein DD-endopeptidase MepM/ murein hydrolase activator NlpD
MTTSRRQRYVHLLVHHDGAPASRSWRLSLVAWRALIAGAALAVLAVLAGLILLGPLARAAGRVPSLERRVRNLEADNARITDLARALDSLTTAYERVRGMVGADVVPDLAHVASDSLPVAPPIEARGAAAPTLPTGLSAPRVWPLRDAGFITRGMVPDSSADETHPGVDIAVAMRTPVRAAGGATVAQTGEDADYGKFVLLQHPDDYQTLYGHLSRVLVTRGRTVRAGEVIGLSGNSGRSTAPHLHFEIRKAGRSVDPLGIIQEAR